MKAWITAFGSGLVFSIGLALSGMSVPTKVLGFLDVTGRWDPSLAFVMGGAVLFGLAVVPRVLRRARPVLDARFHLPATSAVDARLVTGSVLFGLGWGLAGYCPAPAIASIGAGSASAVLFVGAMVAGMGLFEAYDWLRKRTARSEVAAQTAAQSA